MQPTVAVPKPPVAPTPQPFYERLRIAHQEGVNAGASGPFIFFLASISSTFVLMGKGCVFLYNRIRGYA